MPLPTPTENESQDEFISRCMADETVRADFPDEEQRAAVCFRQWGGDKALSEFDDLPLARYDLIVPGNGTGLRHSSPKGMAFGYFLQEAGRELPPETVREIRQKDGTIGDLRKALETHRATAKAKADDHNALKAVKRTDDTITVANYIVLFDGRDLEGHGSDRINPDGSLGEYFTKSTSLDSPYTQAGALYVDWEHAQGEAGDDILGIVDWKTAKIDDKGVFVQRVLQRRNQYVAWLDELGWFDDGTLGTSSDAVPDGVEKAADGQITRWPLRRDTITVSPMEPRMLNGNQLQAFKALGIPVPDDTGAEGHETTANAPTEATPEPEHETAPEAAAETSAAVAVAKAKARLQTLKLSLLEER